MRDLVSYRTLRRTIGILGISLPFVVSVGYVTLGEGTGILVSISEYYGTNMRDSFVGILFTVAWFLFAYRGHKEMGASYFNFKKNDDIVGDLACIFALGVALFPTTSTHRAVEVVHLTSALSLFLVFAYFSFFLFTKSDGNPSPKKPARNMVYRICGVIIVVCIVLIAIFYNFFKNSSIVGISPAFWLETIALWAFGFSWLIKGETIWRDKQAASQLSL